MDESGKKALDFIRQLQDLELISKGQADLLRLFVEDALPFYKNNDELSAKYKEMASLLGEYTKSILDSDDANQAPNPDLLEKLKELPKVELDLAASSLQRMERNKQLNLFKEIGLIEHSKNQKIRPQSSFALFFSILNRLTYSATFIQDVLHKANKEMSDELRKVTEKAKRLPQNIKTQLRRSSIDVSKYLLLGGYEMTGHMPDHVNIYEYGPTFYSDKNQSLFVFASTSGLIIPTEYTGEIDKQFLRQSYFDDGFFGLDAKLLKRYYQWDRKETALELFENYQSAYERGRGKQYIELSAKILSRALADPLVEITIADFNSSGAGMARLKKSLTLSCSAGIIETNRDQNTRHIARADTITGAAQVEYFQKVLRGLTSKEIIPYWAHSIADWGHHNSITISDAIYEYIYCVGVDEIVKKFGQTLDEKDASEVVKREILFGEQIFIKNREGEK